MSENYSPLVFDIGMHNGDDTAFYLSCGFRVVAVEADPSLAAQARARFSDEIALGKLIIKNVGISQSEGVATFWINSERTHFNSFDKEIAGRFGDEIHPVQIPCQSFSDLIGEFGVPYYAKIDIEGNDIICVRQLKKEIAPEFISVEMTLSENLPLALSEIGYSKFKIVRQHGFVVPRSTSLPLSEFVFRFLNKKANHQVHLRTLRKRVFRRAAATLLSIGERASLWGQHNEFQSRINPEWVFNEGSSGSFGNDLPGSWMTLHDIGKIWCRDLEYYQQIGRECWCDLHATL